MWVKLRSVLYRYVPSHIDDPFALVKRMLQSRNKAARHALAMTIAGVLSVPFDLILRRFERRLYEREQDTVSRPCIFVCGPARSGTTVVYQLLAQHLSCDYFANFTTLFPRSPVIATKIFGRSIGRQNFDLQNYYGKTAGWLGPSEANHLWNNWVGEDHTGFRTRWMRERESDFRDALLSLSILNNRPIIMKNNNANVFAHEIVKVLPNSVFICLDRKSEFLAQSLLHARDEIRGDRRRSYGVMSPDWRPDQAGPIQEVCKQVSYFKTLAKEQEDRLGRKKFWIVSYEEFCMEPGKLVDRLVSECGVFLRNGFNDFRAIPPLVCSNEVRDGRLMNEIKEELSRNSSANE